MPTSIRLLAVALAARVIFSAAPAIAFEPVVTQLQFDTAITESGALDAIKAAPWLLSVEQQGGRFRDDTHCWYVSSAEPEGISKLTLTVDRTKLNENLVATLLFEANNGADLAIQLFDKENRVVAVDLFGSLVDVGDEAKTNTFIIPLRKYPTASKIVIRRISGEVKVYGAALFPAVTEAEIDRKQLEDLANALGDPLSPENPLVKNLQSIANKGKLAIDPIKPLPIIPPASVERIKYAGAEPPPKGIKATAPVQGLIAHWNFEKGDGTDASGGNHHGGISGTTELSGPHGTSLKLDRKKYERMVIPVAPDLNLRETGTVAAWIKFATLAPRWGSQIAWFGDSQFGRDPFVLHIFRDGTLELRSDRSITGKPKFVIFDNEIYLNEKGEPEQSQQVAVESPGVLAPNTWYFVTGTIERTNARESTYRLYINGEQVGEVRSPEQVNYASDKMWWSLGSVDGGGWQNFDGNMDDVRIYNRALTPTEVKALYQQPWTGK